ncbi:MAG: hypothetical protein AAGG79_07795 [Pseudomonadota bacterium]
MKNPFRAGRDSEDMWDEALKTLRYAVRKAARRDTANPFAIPLPCPLGGVTEQAPRPSATVLRVF